MKIFFLILIQNPKIWLPGLMVPIAQLLKYSGVCAVDQTTLNGIMDAVSGICGTVAIIFALMTEYKPKAKNPNPVTTAEKPTNLP